MRAIGVVDVNGVVYTNNEIFTIVDDQPFTPLKFGVNWDYVVDAPPEECRIVVYDNTGKEHIFSGIAGLNGLVEWLYRTGIKKKPKQTIWVLTSQLHDYDQPSDVLMAWWPTKPTAEQLTKALQKYSNYTPPESEVTKLLTEGHDTDGGYGTTSYELQEWTEED